jgi:GYF domain 2
MSSHWLLVKKDGELGPYTSAQMRQMALSGKLTTNDLVRRADQTTPVEAAKIRGLLPHGEAPDSRRTTPPPLPSVRTRSETLRSSGVFPDMTPPALDRLMPASPPLPTKRTNDFTVDAWGPPTPSSSRTVFDEIRKRFLDLNETTKEAGNLAVAEFRKATLTNISLRAAYIAFGRHIFAGGLFRSEFPETYAEIERVQAEITGLTMSTEGKPCSSIAEKAGQTASKFKNTAHAKALGLKLDWLMKRLGKVAFADHKEKSGSEDIGRHIRDCLSQISEAQGRIYQHDLATQGRSITPRRILYGVIAFVALMLLVITFAIRK